MRFDELLGDLVRADGAHLIRLAFQLTHDRASAEDIVQEALFEVCRSWRRRTGRPDNLRAYVRRTVVNEFLKHRPRNEPASAAAELADVAQPSFDSDVAERDALWIALGRLSPMQRAVLVLRYYEDLADVDIASILRCRPATVRSHAARGLAALRAADGTDLATVAIETSERVGQHD